VGVVALSSLSCVAAVDKDDGGCIGKCDSADLDQGHFEYVVVGAGAGGGPLAANLARAGHSVLLLEAGDYVGPNLTYQVPAFHTQASEDPSLSWSYFVSHYDDPALAARDTKFDEYNATDDTRGILYPRGSTVGGSTAVNAMIIIYPHENDWHGIADLTGDDSWRPDEMRKYFERMEDNQYLGRFDDHTGHGFEGWLPTSQPDTLLALGDGKIRTIVKSAAYANGSGLFGNLGQLVSLLGSNVNVPGPERDQLEGIFTIPTATREGRRSGANEYILGTVDAGYPLTIRTRALVTNVVFADEPGPDGQPRAIGVDYLQGSNLYRADVQSNAAVVEEERRVTVANEVIISAGAFNTPQLLMLSGIGPRAELERHGIDVRVDLPGVGTNLQDRYEVGVISEASSDFGLIEDCTFNTMGDDPCLDDWEDGDGPYTSNGGTVALVHRSSTAGADPDLIIFGLPGFFKGYYQGYSADVTAQKNMFTWAILKGHTRNTAGTVRLRSTDPRDTPLIDFAYFAEGGDEDLEAMIDGVEFVRSILAETEDQNIFWSAEEIWPGPSISTREQVGQWVRDEAWGHHASCTAPIGSDSDPMAVLDSRFRVRGVQGLRVVDASVFPEIPGFFIVTPTFMISEKATADARVRERRGPPHPGQRQDRRRHRHRHPRRRRHTAFADGDGRHRARVARRPHRRRGARWDAASRADSARRRRPYGPTRELRGARVGGPARWRHLPPARLRRSRP
jgi:choline dehydrogenase